MYTGLIHDTITDKWYFCQTEHDGWYGRMAQTDGSYTVNGQSVYLTFNQQHDGTFGAITSGLESLQSTGVATQDVAGIPEDSATATEAPQQSVQPSTNQSSTDTRSEMDKLLNVGFDEERVKQAEEMAEQIKNDPNYTPGGIGGGWGR